MLGCNHYSFTDDKGYNDMKYIINTWETLHCRYEADATSKENAWTKCLNNEAKQIEKKWLDNGTYIVETSPKDAKDIKEIVFEPDAQALLPGNVIDFQQSVDRLKKKKKK
jgi:hypothetical protein